MIETDSISVSAGRVNQISIRSPTIILSIRTKCIKKNKAFPFWVSVVPFIVGLQHCTFTLRYQAEMD